MLKNIDEKYIKKLERLDNMEVLPSKKNLNEKYIEELERLADYQHIKPPYSKKKGSSELYFDAILKDIDYNEGGMFLTKNIYRKLRDVLNSKKNFNTLKASEKEVIQAKLNALNYKEYEWKSPKRFYHEPSLASRVNTESCEKFISNFENYKNPTLKELAGQRAYTHFFNYKVKGFLKGFASIMDDNVFKVFSHIKNFDDDDIEIISNEHLINSWVFSEMVKVAYKKGHDNLFNKSVRASQAYNYKIPDSVLTLTKSEFLYSFADIFALQILNATFNYLTNGLNLELSEEDLITIELECNRVINNKLFNFKQKGQKDFWGVHLDNTKIVVDILENSEFYRYITKEKERNNMSGKYSTNIKYVLFEAPESVNTPITHFPRVYKPKKLSLKDIEHKIKPMIFGYGSVSKSKTLLKTLNISQSKKFKINSTCTKLIEMFLMRDNLSVFTEIGNSNSVKLPVASISGINSQREEVESLESIPVFNKVQRMITSNLRRQFVGEPLVSFPMDFLLTCTGMSKIERYILFEKQKAQSIQSSLIMKDRYALTLLELADVFRYFPIYITDTLCFRLRLYPQQPLISRTSGDFKYLLSEFDSQEVSKGGLESMLESYYECDEKLKLSFSRKRSECGNMEKLFEFFHNNPLDFTKTRKIIYFSLLHIELNKVCNSGKTDFPVEIDQNSSGVTFLAFILRNRKLAEITGLIPGEDGITYSEGPYTYCLKRFKEFYEQTFESKNEKVFHLLNSNKKLHKYAMMCFCYSQTHVGRMSDFQDAFTEFYGEFPNEDERKVLNEFAIKYLKFQDFLFPGLEAQLKLFQRIVEIAAMEKGEVSVRTLEGEVLTWAFYEYTSQVRTTIDPFTKHPKKFRLTRLKKKEGLDEASEITPATETLQMNNNNKIEINMKQFKKNFLVYLIHSIDAAIIRHFIKVMYEKHKYRINHLHDCVLIHPNHVDNFYSEVYELYSSDKMYNMVDTLVFDQIRANLSTDSQIELDKLKKEFYDISDNFRNEINIKPKILYSPES